MRRQKAYFCRNIIFIGLIILLPGILAGCKSQRVGCPWTAHPMAIDGQRTDWNDVPFTYFEDQDVVLGLSNDDDNLYVFFSFKNPQWARTIQMSGITLWIDGAGKKNKEWGLRYRGGPEMPGDSRERFQDKSMEMGAPFAIISKIKDQEYIVDTSGADGPAVSASISNDIYTYEFRIPIMSSDNDLYKSAATPGQIIGIGSEWGAMPEKRKRPEGGRPGGGDGFPGGSGGGIGGGRPGGGMGGGPLGGGRGMQMPEKQEIWVKAALAEAPTKN